MIPSQNIKTLPIFMYHALSEKQEPNRYIIRKDEFAAHLECLLAENISTILAEDYYNKLLAAKFDNNLLEVVLTFDDGAKSDYEIVLPLLQEYDLVATFFITTDWIDTPGYMTVDQVRQLKEAGMSVQSHGKSHAFLSELEPNELYRELDESKKKLEEILGKKVYFLSFPGGRYNKHVIAVAKELGYQGVFSSNPFQRRLYDTFYLLGRYGVTSPFSKANFSKIIHLNNVGRFKILLLANSKFLLKKILGNKLYYCLWKKYMLQNK